MTDQEPLTPEEAPKDQHRPGESILRFLKELPILIVVALAIALLIKAFLVQAFYIQMGSMEPTLHPGDRVLVGKFQYRFGKPERGDVVIFRDPRDPCAAENAPLDCDRGVVRRAFGWVAEAFGLPTGSQGHLVKRIVGLPGETLAMEDGEVYVCDEPGCEPVNDDGRPQDGRRIRLEDKDPGPQEDDADVPAVRVPNDRFYVLGDNRAQSSDSRSFGSVPRSDIVGKAFVVIWPPPDWSGL